MTASEHAPPPVPAGEDTIAPADLAARLAAGPLDLVDVRTGAEYRAQRVRGARHVPLDSLDPRKVAEGRAPDARGPTYLLCKGGSRARMAATKLRGAGVACVVVEGGTDACVKAALPTEQDAGRRVWAIERQVRFIAGLLVLTGVALGAFVHPYGYGLAAFIGAGLTFAGATDICGMALVLGRCPWNR
jgi:rhodanese-related sulfurtransferase